MNERRSFIAVRLRAAYREVFDDLRRRMGECEFATFMESHQRELRLRRRFLQEHPEWALEPFPLLSAVRLRWQTQREEAFVIWKLDQ